MLCLIVCARSYRYFITLHRNIYFIRTHAFYITYGARYCANYLQRIAVRLIDSLDVLLFEERFPP